MAAYRIPHCRSGRGFTTRHRTTRCYFWFDVSVRQSAHPDRIVRSQNGQEAKLSYSGGFLGRDYTEVTLKSPGCCRHVVIFLLAGSSWFDDVRIEWVDDHHLQLTYHARSSDQQHCEQRVGEINIVCTSLEWSK